MHRPATRPMAAIAAAALILSLLGFSLLGGCGAGGSADVASVSAPSAAPAAPAAGSAVDAAQFAAAITRPGVTVIDVRTPAEFAAGHLAGAVNIDVQAAGFDEAIGALPATGEYALYCRTGHRSGIALTRLKDLGRSNAYHLAGGIGAWQQAGGAVVTP